VGEHGCAVDFGGFLLAHVLFELLEGKGLLFFHRAKELSEWTFDSVHVCSFEFNNNICSGLTICRQ